MSDLQNQFSEATPKLIRKTFEGGGEVWHVDNPALDHALLERIKDIIPYLRLVVKYAHREAGPAVTWPDGSTAWYRHGKLHRIGDPAIIHARGGKEWWADGKLHRCGGPAVIGRDGSEEWWYKGMRHREDGPAYKRPPNTPSYHTSMPERGWCLYGVWLKEGALLAACYAHTDAWDLSEEEKLLAGLKAIVGQMQVGARKADPHL